MCKQTDSRSGGLGRGFAMVDDEEAVEFLRC